MRIKSVLDAIPPRSPWYPLEPIGVGSPVVEGLRSYITRMASQHRVRVSTFTRPRWTGLVAVVNFQTLNALAGTARDWVDLIQARTGRNDVWLSTCLPLGNAISPQNLLAPWQRWCRECYQAWSDG